MHEHT